MKIKETKHIRNDYSKIIEEIKENSKKNNNVKKDSIIVSMEDVDNSYKLKEEKFQNQEAE